MGTLKALKGKSSLSVITITICTLAFVTLFYTQTISSFSFRLKSCPRRNTAKKSFPDDRNGDLGALNYAADDRFEFDPEECSLVHGKWVFNRSIKPLYSDRTCRYLDRQVSCVKNGRPDSDYRHWEWQPDDCILPRFDPEIALRKLQGKRLMFVGDSLQRGQWQSFVCLIDSVIPQGQKSMKRGRLHTVFKAKEYNATIEFYWAPFLVESNSDLHIIADPKKRILKVDSVAKHAKHWIGVDILVFDTYVWWMGRLRTNSLWGSFANGDEGYHELDTTVSYNIGLKTWANWVDSNLNPNRTRVFFTTMSPLHERSADWGNANGTRCFNETKPIPKKRYWGSGSNKQMMSVVARVVKRMKFPVTLINITQLSEYRIDAHTSIYTELGGKLLTDEQKADPLHYADCVHWCLPGVPDTWNQILYAHLL
ncbi:protein trichome birefringence-like 3 [Sesamum indicum]|uniref:Protein trichome birefringence-like 3 n=1 Tax=Sesamum indicum TaxID=4182 RepID=A0A6I9UKU0_SESIN|nr:protein trichome birefringence-like 3 [Sesamum indicum]XP_020553558.1 protein trichome birefringence-like 3 [Sesamum indicum]XP_020553559.1 protein trichome birefringence-like 3 [Sesamum indicum]XP_020553560.1 protein trichome birefringence-like 3 [Sesamum indicum]